MVYMGRKQHFTLPYNSLDNDVISDLSYGVISGHLSRPMNIKENFWLVKMNPEDYWLIDFKGFEQNNVHLRSNGLVVKMVE